LQEALRVLRVRGERYEEREPALRPAVLRERIKLGTLGERIKGARSVAELREIAGDLREHRRSDEVRNTIIGFYIDMLDTGLAMATHRSERILNALSDLARDGKDVSALKDLLAKADENIADARSMIRELHAAIDSGSYENLGEIKQDMKEAAGKLKEAYRIFSSIIVSAKAL
jgi:hypothetical protein